jgi:hypothetical protein
MKNMPWLVVIVLIGIFTSCKREPVPVPQDETPVLCLYVSGLGADHLGKVYDHMVRREPLWGHVRFAGRDNYQTDVRDYVLKSRHKRLVVICHSWGSARAMDLGGLSVDLLVLYDPVGFDQGALVIPESVRKTIVFPRERNRWLVPFTAPIRSSKLGQEIVTIQLPGGHSDGTLNEMSFQYITLGE